MGMQEIIKFDTYLEPYNGDSNNAIEKTKKIKNILMQLTTVSKFEDTQWILNLQKKGQNSSVSSYTVYFSSIPKQYIDIVKLNVLLISLKSKTMAYDFPGKIFHLLNFCDLYSIKLSQFNIKIFAEYENYLLKLKKKNDEDYHQTTLYKIWNNAKMFFTLIAWHPDLAYINELNNRTAPIKQKDSRYDKRLPIENEKLFELDSYFYKKDIPHHYKLAYWIIRLFPLRISEALNMSLNCIKYVNKDFVMLSFPNLKTNGGFSAPVFRTELLFTKDKYQLFLLKLIEEQQLISRGLQSISNEQNLLFTYKRLDNNKSTVLTRSYFSKILKDIQFELGFKNTVTAHQFRTTGATLRAEHGFTSVQLKELLNIDLDTVSTYSKLQNHSIVKIQNDLIGNTIEPKAFFKGKIINTQNSYMEQQIIKNPLAHKLPDMGYCAYENKCGSHYDCLECDYLIPDIELIEYYRETATSQLNKSDFWAKKGNSMYQKDSLHRATLFTKLYEKALMAMRNKND